MAGRATRTVARGFAPIAANLTPLIDLSFLLVIFFVLVLRISGAERVPLELPTPEESVSELPNDDRRTVVSVVPDASDPSRATIQAGGRLFTLDPEGLDEFRGFVAAARAAAPEAFLNVRADAALPYSAVRPVLEAIADSGGAPPKVQLVVRREGRP